MNVIARNLDNMKVEITSGSHKLIADEPVSSGGEDAGPSPYDLLLSSLGACKVITVQMYARRKGWELESVEVSLDLRREYARDCEDCVSEDNVMVGIIDCEVSFRGNLSREQIERLKGISERCPVHQILTKEIVIHTRLSDAPVRQ